MTNPRGRPRIARSRQPFLFDFSGGKISRREYALWTAAAALCFCGFYIFHRFWYNAVSLKAAAPVYYHDDIIKVRLSTRNRALLENWRLHPPVVRLAGMNARPVGGMARFYMTPVRNGWAGQMPCPWNAPPGSYRLELEGGCKYLKAGNVEIARRVPAKMPPKFVVLTMEYAGDYRSLRMKLPDGTIGGKDAPARWAKHLGADAVWALVGKTSGVKGAPWNTVDLASVREVGRQCHARGVKFGVWVMCYLTHIEKNNFFPRYQWAQEIENGRLKNVRAVSLRDGKRPDDIADLLIKFRDMPEVDYLGLDYIRNALGGYELMDDFYAEMPWAPRPENWDRLSPGGKTAAFAAMKVARKNKQFIDDWQWWRARSVARIVRHIKDRLGPSKPLWAFTLGWERGWQHGQDPPMINDAGADYDAVMLYEATSGQFAEMMSDWGGYLKSADVQLVAGNVIDWPLHQNAGLGEYKSRFSRAMRRMYSDGNVPGIFVHDLCRLVGGRKGPASTEDWARATREVIAEFRALPDKK
ncbi:MAG: hypothetical protein WC421_08920 [Elusimicrobiales bacterium]